MMEGWERQYERQCRMLAWAVAQLLAPHVERGGRQNLLRDMLRSLVGEETFARWEKRRNAEYVRQLAREG